MNTVCIVGRVASMGELKTTPTDRKVIELRLAVPKGFRREDGADFIQVEVWGKLAEQVVAKYAEVGRELHVTGRLAVDEWESDGDRRSRTKVVAAQVGLGRRAASQTASDDAEAADLAQADTEIV